MTFQLRPDDIYRTGIPNVDEQHDQFVGLIVRFQSTSFTNTNDPQLTELASQLLAYARLHFRTEESLMRLANYAGLESHAAEHARILAELKERAASLGSGQATRAQFVMFLWKWLVDHTNLEDKAMAAHLNTLDA